MILKEVKRGQYKETKKALRDAKVNNLRADAKRLVDIGYMPLADDEIFVEEMRNGKSEGGADTLYYHDFSHISEGAFKETVVRIPWALSRLIFLKQIDRVNRSLI